MAIETNTASELRTASTEAAEEARIRDAYARRGSQARDSFFNAAHLFTIQERERRVLPLLARYGYERLDTARTLEIGCGTGQWLRDFVKWGARPEHLAGVDLLPDRLDTARRVCPPGIVLECRSAAALGFPGASFDIVLQSTVFTSILDADMRRAVAAEMLRVLRPGGIVLWYDYHVNNPSNPDVRAVKADEIARLFPGCRIELRRVTLAPPLARAIVPYSRMLGQLLELFPPLRTHYLGVFQKTAP